MSVTITSKQYHSQIRRVVNANLKNRGTSLSEATISNHVSREVVIEMDCDGKTYLVVDNWRQKIKRYLEPKTEHWSQVWENTDVVQHYILNALSNAKRRKQPHLTMIELKHVLEARPDISFSLFNPESCQPIMSLVEHGLVKITSGTIALTDAGEYIIARMVDYSYGQREDGWDGTLPEVPDDLSDLK